LNNMQSGHFVLAVALVAGASGTALAQTQSDPAIPPQAPAAQTAAPAQATTQAVNYGPTRNHWTLAGFMGSDFNQTGNSRISTDSSLSAGGQASYLWHGMVGAEALADFTPSFHVNSLALTDNPHLNTYMANGIFAYPLGDTGQFEPYVSGGFGSIQMRANVVTSILTAAPVEGGTVGVTTTQSNQHWWGSNFGGGVMGFAGNVGFRADVRRYRATENTDITGSAVDQFTKALLSDLAFWRTSVGVAFRW
jgi:hypothetical protein